MIRSYVQDNFFISFIILDLLGINSIELVIGAGDYSYTGSADCWFEIIQPFKSKMKIAMGDHEYIDTSGGATGIINQYLKPLNLEKTHYTFDMKNVHFTIIDPLLIMALLLININSLKKI